MTPIQARVPVRMCKDETFAAIREGLVLMHQFDRNSALEMATRWRSLNARAEEAYYSQPGLTWNIGDPHVYFMGNEKAGLSMYILDFQPAQQRSIDEAQPDRRVIVERHHYTRHASTPYRVEETCEPPWLSRAMRQVLLHSSWAPLLLRIETYDPDNDCATLKDYAQMTGPQPPFTNEVESW